MTSEYTVAKVCCRQGYGYPNAFDRSQPKEGGPAGNNAAGCDDATKRSDGPLRKAATLFDRSGGAGVYRWTVRLFEGADIPKRARPDGGGRNPLHLHPKKFRGVAYRKRPLFERGLANTWLSLACRVFVVV